LPPGLTAFLTAAADQRHILPETSKSDAVAIRWGGPTNSRDLARTPEQAIDLYRVISMNNLDVKTIAPAHGAGPKPYDNLKKAIGILPP
jgi:hypothetical protein